MNETLKIHLGAGNCGPVEFSEQEQMAMLEQIVVERVKNSGFIPSVLNNFDLLSSLYGDARKYCSPDVIKNYARHEDLTLALATQRFADGLGISCGSIFGTDLSSGRQGPPHRLAETGYFSMRNSYNCHRTFPSTLHLHGIHWNLIKILQYSATDGDFVAGEAIYSDPGTDKYFALNIYADKMRDDVANPPKELHLGYQHKQYRLLGEDLMLDKPELPVFIFHDKRIAAPLLEMAGLKFVPSTFGGRYDNISDVCLEPLFGKTVSIVPLASKESYRSLAPQAEAILKAGAKKVFIATIPLLLHPKITLAEEQSIISDRLIRHIVVKAQVIGKDGELGFDLTNHRFLPPEFERWACGHALISDSPSAESGRGSISSLLAKSSVFSHEYLLEELLAPEYLSGCIGDTHSGKTLFAYTLALSLACGIDVFGFSSCNKRHVLYIDAETTGKSAAAKITQLAVGYGCRQEDLDKYFHLWSVKDHPIASLTTEETRQQIESEIAETGAKLIVFDNLLTQAPEVVQAPTKWTQLSSWFQQLSMKYGTAVLFLHHLGKDGSLLGLQQIRANTHNIFKISHAVGAAQEKPGCLMTVTIQKNKKYAALDGVQATYFLDPPIFGPESGTPWRKVEEGCPEYSAEAASISTSYAYDDSLSSDENDILKHILERGVLKRKDVEKLLDCSESTARNRLHSLSEKQLIDKIGDGPAARYILRKQATDLLDG